MVYFPEEMLVNSFAKLLPLKNRTIRTINKTIFNSHTDPLFRSSQVVKVPDLYISQSALFMCDYIKNNLPVSFILTAFSLSIGTSKLSIGTSKPSVKHANLIYCVFRDARLALPVNLHTLPKLWNFHDTNLSSISNHQLF